MGELQPEEKRTLKQAVANVGQILSGHPQTPEEITAAEDELRGLQGPLTDEEQAQLRTIGDHFVSQYVDEVKDR